MRTRRYKDVRQEQESERDAQEPQFLTDHAENEVGVLLGKEIEAFLRTLQEPLPVKPPLPMATLDCIRL